MKEVFALGTANLNEQSPLARCEAIAAAVVDFGIAGYFEEARRYAKEMIPLAERAIATDDSHIYARVGGKNDFACYIAHRSLSMAYWVLASVERFEHLQQALCRLREYRAAGLTEVEALRASVRLFVLELRQRIHDGRTRLSELPDVRQIHSDTELRSLCTAETRARILLMGETKDARVSGAGRLEEYLRESIDPAHADGPYLGELQRVDLVLLSECVCSLRSRNEDALSVFSFMRGLPGPA